MIPSLVSSKMDYLKHNWNKQLSMNQIDLFYVDEKWFTSMNWIILGFTSMHSINYVILLLCECPIKNQHIIKAPPITSYGHTMKCTKKKQTFYDVNP